MVKYAGTGRGTRVRPNTGAKLNKRQLRQVKSLVSRRAELDFYDNGLNGTAVLAGATIQGGMSTPVQGVADGQRIGDQIKISKFTFKCDIIYGDPTNQLRIVLFRWYEDNAGALPVLATVLQNGAGFPINSGINHDSLKAGKLHVMHDRTYNLTNTGNTMAINRTITITGRKLGKKKLEFNNGAITGTNHIYALFISDSVGVPNPTINWYSRLMYYDM